jgi:predicted amidohydrolase YtcJ
MQKIDFLSTTFKVFLFINIMMCLLSCEPAKEADLILHNGKIYTVNESFEIAEAIAIKDGKIIAIGAEREIMNKYSAKEVVDLQDKTVYPGFIDAHSHFVGYALHLSNVDLTQTNSFEEVIQELIKYNTENNPEWIMGRGWDNTKWENKNFPTNAVLDSLFPDKPVWIKRVDGHVGLANSKTLELAQIDLNTTSDGGEIVKIDGKLSGILVDKPMDKVEYIIPLPTKEWLEKALLKAQENCFKAGLTTVTDAGLTKREIEIIDELQKSGELKIKVYAMLTDNDENLTHYLSSGPYKSERLNVCSFKFYADGALGSRGACLLHPYSDMENHYGKLQNPITHYQEFAQQLYDKGFQMNTHCIGDSAVRMMIKVYANVLKSTNDKRWRIEHAQVVNKNDFNLFSEYTIIPSVQPTHATSDMRWAEKRLGEERIHGAYAYQSLLKQNGLIALGTDFPVENIYPLETYYAAVERKDKTGNPSDGFMKEEALTPEQTLRGMTIWAALASFEENEKGSLEVGKMADLVIVDKDILQLSGTKILEAKILSTYVNGEKVY